MKPEELRTILTALGWSLARLSDETGIADRTVRRMAAGTAPVPAGIQKWLRERYAMVRQHPAPRRPVA